MIFLDNASTTKIYNEALEEYVNFSRENYFNASSLYKNGVQVSVKVNNARKTIIKLLGGSVFDNLIFTSGATEANNFAINGCVRKNMGKLLFSIGEHPSVYNVALNLLNMGYDVEFVNLTKDGTVDEKDFINKLTGASFVSIMHINNETGAINNIKKLVQIAKAKNPKIIFHCDGVQAFGKIKVNVSALGVDLYTISAHKIHGPKGVGALYVKKGINLKPILFGGGQEFNLRSGTENTCGIISFCKACELANKNVESNLEYVSTLKEEFVKNITNNFNVVINSSLESLPYIISFAVPKVKAETILHMAENEGVLISNGSACSSKHTDNRILKAMGVENNIIESSVRVSFSFDTKLEEVIKACEIIKKTCLGYIKLLG